MPFSALRRLAVQVHGFMNCAIQPFATEEDGDVLYAVTTDEVENASLSNVDLGVLASELAWDAILRSVPVIPAVPAPLEVQPVAAKLHKHSGTYEFFGGTELTLTVGEGFLAAVSKGDGRTYFDNNRKYRPTAARDGPFLVESAARDAVRFEESGGRITGLTLNPSEWPIHAKFRQ